MSSFWWIFDCLLQRRTTWTNKEISKSTRNLISHFFSLMMIDYIRQINQRVSLSLSSFDIRLLTAQSINAMRHIWLRRLKHPSRMLVFSLVRITNIRPKWRSFCHGVYIQIQNPIRVHIKNREKIGCDVWIGEIHRRLHSLAQSHDVCTHCKCMHRVWVITISVITHVIVSSNFHPVTVVRRHVHDERLYLSINRRAQSARFHICASQCRQ